MDDFKPGLEGVIAFETEIAEPDREGGSLRYRGVDIEELVGRVNYDQVWGLLVNGSLDEPMPDAEPYVLERPSGHPPAFASDGSGTCAATSARPSQSVMSI